MPGAEFELRRRASVTPGGKQVKRAGLSSVGSENVSNSRAEQVQQAVMSRLSPTWCVFPTGLVSSALVQGKTTALT